MNMKINGMLAVTIPEGKGEDKGLADKAPSAIVLSLEQFLNEEVFSKILKEEGITMVIRLNTDNIRTGYPPVPPSPKNELLREGDTERKDVPDG